MYTPSKAFTQASDRLVAICECGESFDSAPTKHIRSATSGTLFRVSFADHAWICDHRPNEYSVVLDSNSENILAEFYEEVTA